MRIYQKLVRNVFYPLVLRRSGDAGQLPWLREFERTQYLPPDELRRLQFCRLSARLSHAPARRPAQRLAGPPASRPFAGAFVARHGSRDRGEPGGLPRRAPAPPAARPPGLRPLRAPVRAVPGEPATAALPPALDRDVGRGAR